MAWDKAGHYAVTNATIIYDNIPPDAPVITSPANGLITKSADISVAGTNSNDAVKVTIVATSKAYDVVPSGNSFSKTPVRIEDNKATEIYAIAYDDDRADIVVDWKSDVDPSDKDMRIHAGQLADYLRVTGASRGALVYMTPGVIRWVTPRQ